MLLRQAHFPYLVQSAMAQNTTLNVETLELHAPMGQEIETETIPVPHEFSDALNKKDGSFALTLSETGVLKRSAEQIFLLVRYFVE